MTREQPDRAITPVVSHVTSVAITTLLIISLVATATGFLDSRQTDAARSELETVGNRLSSELAAVDRLARYGDITTVRTRLTQTVVGSTYTAQLVTDASCSGVPTTTCLRLEPAEYDLSTIVPVQNETELHFEAQADGVFVISANGSSGTPAPTRRQIEMSPRIGIGQNVGAVVGIGPGTGLSQAPIAKFIFNPDPPEVGETVEFDASASWDPDGSITTYEWDWDNDSTFETTDSDAIAFHTFGSPGDHNVTLRVTDGAGATANTTHEVDVSGLVYNGDMSRASPGDNDAITLSVTNSYGTAITIERVMIDPTNDAHDSLDGSSEIEVDVGLDGAVDGSKDWSGGVTIPEDGRIGILDTTATVPSGDSAELLLQEFSGPNVQNEEFTVGVRYKIEGTGDVGANTITDTAAP